MRRPALRDALLAVAVAAVLAGVILGVDPSAGHRTRFASWTPLVSVLGTGLWLLAAWLDRRRPALARTATSALVGVALATAAVATPRYVGRVLAGEHVRAWNVFHYHLGSKYFDELGYTELYAAVLAADDAWQAHKDTLPPAERAEADAVADFRFVRQTRDMRTYAVIPRTKAVRDLRATLSDARLTELGRDSRALRPWMSEETWRQVFVDLGYNPAPPWTVLGMPLARGLPPDGDGIWWIANSDLPLWISTIAALWWGFGPRIAAGAVLFLVAIPFNEARWTGGLLQYDWLASVVVAMACWRRGWGATAGVLLSWGAMTRIFPGLLVLPAVGAALVWVWRRTSPRPTVLLRFVAAFVASCAVLLVLSHGTGLGTRTWPAWADNIARHTERHPLTSWERIGVKRLALHDPTADRFWQDHPGRLEQRLARIDRLAPGLQLLAFAFLVPALFGRRRTDAMLLMLYAAFVLTVASRYYGSIWILLLALALPEPDDEQGVQGLPGVWAGAVLLAMPALMAAPLPDEQGSYFLVNYAAWAMFAGACALFVMEDWRTHRAYALSADNETETPIRG